MLPILLQFQAGYKVVTNAWQATQATRALSMNRSAELQLGAARRAPNTPTWRSALQSFIVGLPRLAASCWCAPERQSARPVQWERPPVRPFRLAASRVGFEL